MTQDQEQDLKAEAQGLEDALIVLAGALPVFGMQTLFSTLTRDGVDVVVMATEHPSLVKGLTLLQKAFEETGFVPDQALVEVIQSHLNDRANMREPRWVQGAGEWAKRVDGVEVTRWYAMPGEHFVMELPDLHDGLARRRVLLQATTFDEALTEVNTRFPLAAWWDEVIDAPQGGAQ